MSQSAMQTVSRWLWRLLKIAVVVALLAGIIYWVRFRPAEVLRHTVARGPIASEVMGTGTLEARIKATVSPKISGRIESVLVDQGDRVTTGQLLVKLDDAELLQQVAIANADIETKQAGIQRLATDISRAAAVVRQAKTNYKRMRALVKKNAISRDELGKSTEALAIAEAESSRASAALSEGQKALTIAERTFDFQTTKLTDSQIKAPFDGLIIRRTRDPGDVVVPGSAILSLISMDELWINAWVDETEMARLKPDQNAEVVFRSEASKPLPGRLVRLAKETDRETREFIVDVEVLELPENWAVGQRAEVFIQTDRNSDTVTVPSHFIIRSSDQMGVFVDQDGVVTWQPVELGLRGRDHVEITNGVEEGQSILLPLNPSKKLRAGQRITEE